MRLAGAALQLPALTSFTVRNFSGRDSIEVDFGAMLTLRDLNVCHMPQAAYTAPSSLRGLSELRLIAVKELNAGAVEALASAAPNLHRLELSISDGDLQSQEVAAAVGSLHQLTALDCNGRRAVLPLLPDGLRLQELQMTFTSGS